MTSETTDGQPAVVKVPHGLLGVILAAVLAALSGGAWLISTVTGISKDVGYVKDDTKVLMRMIETNNAYISAETNRVNFVVGLLSKQKRAELYEYDRNNPMPPRIVEIPKDLKEQD